MHFVPEHHCILKPLTAIIIFNDQLLTDNKDIEIRETTRLRKWPPDIETESIVVAL